MLQYEFIINFFNQNPKNFERNLFWRNFVKNFCLNFAQVAFWTKLVGFQLKNFEARVENLKLWMLSAYKYLICSKIFLDKFYDNSKHIILKGVKDEIPKKLMLTLSD